MGLLSGLAEASIGGAPIGGGHFPPTWDCSGWVRSLGCPTGLLVGSCGFLVWSLALVLWVSLFCSWLSWLVSWLPWTLWASALGRLLAGTSGVSSWVPVWTLWFPMALIVFVVAIWAPEKF